jgi:thiol:disulfide interchange protein DsbC
MDSMSILSMKRALAAAMLAPVLGLAAGAVLAQPAAKPAAKAAPDAQAAPAAVDGAVRKALEPILRGRKIDEVRATPLAGIFEARIGNELLYIDGKGKYLFWQGDLIDLTAQRNLTQERVEALMAIRFEDLPLELAVKQVLGKGSRRIAVFEDPNCGFCKRLRADLMKLDDLTIYTFPMAFLAADSDSKARKALCADDPIAAWNDLLLKNVVPGNPGTCQTSIEKVRELSQSLGITGTPVVFFENGKRLSGYEPPERFEQRLSNNSVR